MGRSRIYGRWAADASASAGADAALTAGRADLACVSMTAPARSGGRIAVAAVVSNVGNRRAGASAVVLRLSADRWVDRCMTTPAQLNQGPDGVEPFLTVGGSD
jgi:hypothetical protein